MVTTWATTAFWASLAPAGIDVIGEAVGAGDAPLMVRAWIVAGRVVVAMTIVAPVPVVVPVRFMVAVVAVVVPAVVVVAMTIVVPVLVVVPVVPAVVVVAMTVVVPVLVVVLVGFAVASCDLGQGAEVALDALQDVDEAVQGGVGHGLSRVR